MSYELVLAVDVPSRAVGERLVAATAGPGLVSLVHGRRGVSLDYEEGQGVLDDAASWDEEAFTLAPEPREALARTVLAVAEVVPTGWSLRSAWFDDPLEREEHVTAAELAELVRRSALRRDALYRVVG